MRRKRECARRMRKCQNERTSDDKKLQVSDTVLGGYCQCKCVSLCLERWDAAAEVMRAVCFRACACARTGSAIASLCFAACPHL